ncbi:MAG: cyclic nucleotide-binding domain-containing protein [Treponema sp.]|nr:cyclic nucleotide-binding domain-containing protein [Treponema sp.]
MGSLIVLLIHVYFFFTFFFLGAQFAFVSDSFDALLFSKLRQIRRKADTKSQGEKSAKRPVRPDLLSHLFVPEESNLNKYLRIYKQNEIIISQGEPGDDVYYLLKGEVEILLSSPQNEGSSSGILNAGSFFGEMSYLLSEDRSATIRAKTDVSVFVLPPHVFDAILKYDTSLDRDIIEHMSRRLKNTTAQLITLKSGSNV